MVRLLLAFLLYPSILCAQSYSLQILNTSTEVELEGLSAVEAVQENLTGQELDLRMELLELSAPLSWDIILCSPNFCAAPGEYDMLYHLDSGQNDIVKISFSPGLQAGTASGVWVMTDVDQPEFTDTIYVTASTIVGVQENEADEIEVRQHQDGITITSAGPINVQVWSLSGQLISSVTGSGSVGLRSSSTPTVKLIEITTADRRSIRRVVF